MRNPVAGVDALGLSPRVRGKPGHSPPPPAARRSIPACAGEALPRRLPAAGAQVYPRVCGGSDARPVHWQGSIGLSPRVRGKQRETLSAPVLRGSIPACAGEACRYASRCRRHSVYPRVCGGSCSLAAAISSQTGLSPRVRGKLLPVMLRQGHQRSIPACAGEAHTSCSRPALPTVYPRVCGGSLRVNGDTGGVQGLSPRVRGKPPSPATSDIQPRSIPACAGEAGC